MKRKAYWVGGYVVSNIYEKSFLICGLARNVGKTIENDLLVLERTLERFKKTEIFIVESDSNDNTLVELERLSSERINLKYITLGKLRTKISNRIDRIAHCRQHYFNYVKKTYREDEFDYIIVYDFDGINDKLTDESFVSNWKQENWDVITANQDGPYYDIYALRHKLWCPNGFDDESDFFKSLGISNAISSLVLVNFRQIIVPKSFGLIKVDSAFGGIAIYKSKAFFSSEGYINPSKRECEHVTFHKSIREFGYEIFINSEFINADFTEHTSQFKFGIRFILIRIKILIILILGYKAYDKIEYVKNKNRF